MLTTVQVSATAFKTKLSTVPGWPRKPLNWTMASRFPGVVESVLELFTEALLNELTELGLLTTYLGGIVQIIKTTLQ